MVSPFRQALCCTYISLIAEDLRCERANKLRSRALQYQKYKSARVVWHADIRKRLSG